MHRAFPFVVLLAACTHAPVVQPAATSVAPSMPPCRSIETDPEWTAIASTKESSLADDAAFCAHRKDCCFVRDRMSTSSAHRVVKLALTDRADDGSCTDAENSAVEYWYVETNEQGIATSIRLLVASHFAPYAPERGAVEEDTFLWSHQDTCYGYTSSTCGEWGVDGRIALSPSPHVIEAPAGERTCEGTMPLLISVDW